MRKHKSPSLVKPATSKTKAPRSSPKIDLNFYKKEVRTLRKPHRRFNSHISRSSNYILNFSDHESSNSLTERSQKSAQRSIGNTGSIRGIVKGLKSHRYEKNR
jgi:phage-related protein